MLDNNEFLSIDKTIKKRRIGLLNRRFFTDLIRKVFLLFLIVYLIFSFVFGIIIMPNNDMSPKIGPSDLIFYYRLEKNFLAEDVVVVNKNGNDYVSRIVAVEGDEVDITESGLIINGAAQSNQNIFYPTRIYEEGIKFPIKLQQGEIFVLGDLREGAMDSRYFGAVNKEEIKGKVFTLLRRTKF